MRISTSPLAVIRTAAVLAVCLTFSACRNRSDAKTTVPADRETSVLHLPAMDLAGGKRANGAILITVDTLRADYLSCYGHTRVLTPSFDRFSQMSVVFRNTFSQASTTTPSHSSIMTSLYLQDHNVYSNFEALGDTPQTLAETFKAAGYATYAIVNMRHLNPEVGNLAQGFQHFVRSGNSRRAAASFDDLLNWIDAQQGKPFFAWVHLADVHTPYRPPPPYDRFYYDDDEHDPSETSLARIWPTLPKDMSDHPSFQAWLEGITDVQYVLAQYQGAVTYVDDEFGRLLDELDNRRILSRTAVILTADHGESLGEHGMYFVHTGLYDATTHIPLITWFPGDGRHGAQVRDIVESVDIYPTLLEYMGLTPPEGIRGRSLLPLVRGGTLAPKNAFIEHAGRNLVAIRSERYAYVRHLRTAYIQPSYTFTNGREELYDLQSDPDELHDISKEKPEAVALFRAELARRRTERLDLAIGKAEVTAETTDVLRSLGYVQ
ncbi:MAG: sulfatase [Clostridia bacterium]|nr:sulfatase [Deltaproteobacteria bacterium]